VDFIFGWSTAVFNRCHIHSIGNGYVTAPATLADTKYGYVFYDCTLTAADGVNKVYLSRPWRPNAQAVYIRCNLGKHIVPEGWNNWNKKDAEKTVTYAEYQSTGDGASPSTRAKFGKQLKSLKGYDMNEVLGGTDGWNPAVNGNSLLEIKR
jgi:pectinesterase